MGQEMVFLAPGERGLQMASAFLSYLLEVAGYSEGSGEARKAISAMSQLTALLSASLMP